MKSGLLILVLMLSASIVEAGCKPCYRRTCERRQARQLINFQPVTILQPGGLPRVGESSGGGFTLLRIDNLNLNFSLLTIPLLPLGVNF